MGLFDKLFRNKEAEKVQNDEKKEVVIQDDWMISQLAAMYCQNKDDAFRNEYLSKLGKLGILKEKAEKIFNFECSVVEKYDKSYLLNPEFTKMWFFDLKKPFFTDYPKNKEDIIKEQFLTLSELCKIVDEAEWHFWNSHEGEVSNEVWGEICSYRLKGMGMEFASNYLDMVCDTQCVSVVSVGVIIANQGEHLSKYKWDCLASSEHSNAKQ